MKWQRWRVCRPRARSIRARLMLWNVGTLALILALLGVTLRYTVQRGLIASVDHDLALHGIPPPFGPPRDVMRFVEQGMKPTNLPQLPPQGPSLQGMAIRYQRALKEERGDYWPRVLNLKGQTEFPIVGMEPLDAWAFEDAVHGQGGFSTVSVAGKSLRVYTRIVRREGRIAHVVQSPYPLTEVYRVMADVDRTLLTLIPVALVLAGAGGTLLTGHALRPVRDLTATAARVEAYDLSERLAIIGDDEFSRLTAMFNSMLARLQTAFQQRENLVIQLEERIAQDRRFTADASHELKTPLTVIMANASLLLADASDADTREALADVVHAANSMNRLVQDLLLLARFDNEPMGHEEDALFIGDILEQAQRSIRHHDQPAICLDIPDAKLRVNGNEQELVRLFSNLLENAVRYTPAEGMVEVAVRNDTTGVVVAVRDTGIGIAPEHLPHLGERFYRVDTARVRLSGGTGLGLSICTSIIAAHNGTFAIVSTVGQGTTVTVTLPQNSDFVASDAGRPEKNRKSVNHF